MDPGGAVSRVIAPERAIGCVVYAGTELGEPGVVHHLEGTRFSIGEPNGTISDRRREFSKAMIEGGLKCPVEAQLRDEIWVKLMGNVAFNPLSILTRATLAGMCKHPPTRELVSLMMAETLTSPTRSARTVGLDRAAPGGRRARRRAQALHAPGPRGGQAARARGADRRGRRAGRPDGHRRALPARGRRGQRAAGRLARSHLSAWWSRRATPLRTAAAATAAATDSATSGLNTLGMM